MLLLPARFAPKLVVIFDDRKEVWDKASQPNVVVAGKFDPYTQVPCSKFCESAKVSLMADCTCCVMCSSKSSKTSCMPLFTYRLCI
jgi:hypothetical protein